MKTVLFKFDNGNDYFIIGIASITQEEILKEGTKYTAVISRHIYDEYSLNPFKHEKKAFLNYGSKDKKDDIPIIIESVISEGSNYSIKFTLEELFHLRIYGEKCPEMIKKPYFHFKCEYAEVVDGARKLITPEKRIEEIIQSNNSNDIYIVTDNIWSEVFEDPRIKNLDIRVIWYDEDDGPYHFDKYSGWFYRYITKYEFDVYKKGLENKKPIHKDNESYYEYDIIIPDTKPKDSHQTFSFYFTSLETTSAREAKQLLSLFDKKDYRIRFRFASEYNCSVGKVTPNFNEPGGYIEFLYLAGTSEQYNYVRVELDADTIDNPIRLKE